MGALYRALPPIALTAAQQVELLSLCETTSIAPAPIHPTGAPRSDLDPELEIDVDHDPAANDS